MSLVAGGTMTFGGTSFGRVPGGVVFANVGTPQQAAEAKKPGGGALGVIDSLSQTALGFYNAVRQADLLETQVRHRQTPSIVADRFGRPSGEAAPLLGVSGPGFSIGSGWLVIGAAIVVLLLLVKK